MTTDDELIEEMLVAYYSDDAPIVAVDAMRAALAVVRAHDSAELAALRAELRDTTWQDHADHWQKRAEKAEAEAARLQAAIEQAPHDKHCVYFEISPANWPACVWISPDCDCWKRAALAQEGEG